MAIRQTDTHRLSLFSDGVFGVLITILVLELKPPHEHTFKALLPLWPTGLSCYITYVALCWEAVDRPAREDVSQRMQRPMHMRSVITIGGVRGRRDHRDLVAGRGDGPHLLVPRRLSATRRAREGGLKLSACGA